MFFHELSGCGFEFRYSHLNIRCWACFEQGVLWHSFNSRVQIHSKTRMWHDKNAQSNQRCICEIMSFEYFRPVDQCSCWHLQDLFEMGRSESTRGEGGGGSVLYNNRLKWYFYLKDNQNLKLFWKKNHGQKLLMAEVFRLLTTTNSIREWYISAVNSFETFSETTQVRIV